MKQKKLIILFFLFSIFVMGLLVNANAQNRVIAFRSVTNGKWVCADLDINKYGPLHANRDAVGLWEKFELIPVGGTGYLFALHSLATGKYVSAERNGTRRLVAAADTIGPGQTFYCIFNGGFFSFRTFGFPTPHDGKWVRFDSMIPETNNDGPGPGNLFYWQEF